MTSSIYHQQKPVREMGFIFTPTERELTNWGTTLHQVSNWAPQPTLSGWWFFSPLWKIGVRQLAWWHSQLIWENAKFMATKPPSSFCIHGSMWRLQHHHLRRVAALLVREIAEERRGAQQPRRPLECRWTPREFLATEGMGSLRNSVKKTKLNWKIRGKSVTRPLKINSHEKHKSRIHGFRISN